MTERHEVEKPEFEVLFTEEQIQERIIEMAEEIDNDYKDDQNSKLILVGVLKGGAPFITDLSRKLKHPNVEIDYIGVTSYGENTESLEDPVITSIPTISITGEHVIVVDDIIDTGKTFRDSLEKISSLGPKSLKVCSLLSKPDRREVEVPIDYLGFEIDNLWVQGYGLDTNEEGRNWPYIAYKK